MIDVHYVRIGHDGSRLVKVNVTNSGETLLLVWDELYRTAVTIPPGETDQIFVRYNR